MVWVVIISTLIDFICSLVIADELDKLSSSYETEAVKHRTGTQKAALAISIISRLSFLGYFKYYNFMIENVRLFFETIGLNNSIPVSMIQISLPLGISFYTFQSMSYTIDVYRGKVTATRSFIKFAGYVTMFPQLIAGPIVRYQDIEYQLNNHRVLTDEVIEGIKRFIIGLSKKVLVANTLAPVADRIFELPPHELSTPLAWLGISAYTLQIYFDFSGYSCMAIGLGKMIGFTFPENFNYPYFSSSIREFWRRWHISLSTWFRDYLYIPLGGSKKGGIATYRNLLIVFFVCGLWHGASWNFIIWGLYHGIFLVLERTGGLKFMKRLFPPLQNVYAILVIMIGWIFFRADTLPEALAFLNAMFGRTIANQSQDMLFSELLSNDVLLAMAVGILFSTPIVQTLKNQIDRLHASWRKPQECGYFIILVSLFALCTMSLASGTYNPFIYFRF